jgi:glycosyltransferase involved in cell wall biosynthesis
VSDDGVNLVGYVHDRSGLGEIARLVRAALEHAGIPHVVVPVGSQPLRSRLRPVAPRYTTNIVCVNGQLLPNLVERMGQGLLRDRRTIGFWWWEVDRIPPAMAWSSYLVDEIWVGSDHVRAAIEPSVARPVHVFPVPIVPPRTEPVARHEFGLPEGRFAFVFSFNFWSVFQRKNPIGLIDAFSRAFAPDEGPILVVKTIGWERFRDELAQLLSAAAARPDVFVVQEGLPPERYHGLVDACDAYASLHRAEGFGLTIAEAMALGKPAVATGYSGNLAFMSRENSYLVPSSLVPVPDGLEPYAAGACWAEPDLDEAARQLRDLVERKDETEAKTRLALADFADSHSLDVAAGFIRTRLDAPSAARDVPDDPIELTAVTLMWGPSLDTARPWARRLRQVAQPFLRPYTDHQRQVLTQLLEALSAERESADERGRKPTR